MKKTLLLLLSVGLMVGVAVACGGSDVTDEIGAAAGIVPLPEYVEPENELLGVDDKSVEAGWIDDACNYGSDITFDPDDIKLPDEGDGFALNRTIAAYFSISGEIISIEDIDGVTKIKIIDTDGNEAVLVLNCNTAFLFSDRFAVGDFVTGWYLTNAPMIMIWPPHYNISVLAVGAPDDVNIKVDLFHRWDDSTDGYFLAQSGEFAFNIDENTQIILEDGVDFTDADFHDRQIAVIYGRSTRSIPELATATKLIVFFEGILPGR